MSNEIITYLEIYAVIVAVLYSIWAILAVIFYIKDLPEKRKTCAELYRIRTKKEVINIEEKNIC